MNDFSLIEKLKILMNIIVSSPLFLLCCLIGIITLIVLLIYIKKDKKINKWIFISIFIILFLVLIISYNSIIFKLIDILFNQIFKIIYFPNSIIYLTILVISNFYFVYSIFSKKMQKPRKVINIICALIIDMFLIFIIDIVNKNNINIYDEIEIFSNSNLLVLLELNSGIFISSILLNLLVSANNKLKKYNKDYPKMQEIIFED